MLNRNFIGGLWIAFIGWFLESAAGSQLQLEVLKGLLGEHKVVDAMKRDYPRLPANLTLEEVVDKYVLQTGWHYFVVTDGGGQAGLVTLASVRSVPRAAWTTTTAGEVMIPLQKLDQIRPDAMLWSALEKMGRDGVEQLPVVEGNGIVGILSREDILHYLRVLRAFAT
jgi:CBS domain-containing protein